MDWTVRGARSVTAAELGKRRVLEDGEQGGCQHRGVGERCPGTEDI